MISSYRDIQLVDRGGGSYLAIACDVAAYIGEKEEDVIRISPEMAGYYAAVVPIIELLALGAVPISVADTLGVEMEPTGKRAIEGIKKAMDEAGISLDCLTGSTEDNIPTMSTTIGITIVSELKKDLIQQYKPLIGQYVYLIGLPKMGKQFLEEEILGGKGEVIDVSTVKQIRAMDGIGHMLPVGSKGIAYEVNVMANLEDLTMAWTDRLNLDLRASAGPATCMLVTCDKEGAEGLRASLSQPVTLLGQLV